MNLPKNYFSPNKITISAYETKTSDQVHVGIHRLVEGSDLEESKCVF